MTKVLDSTFSINLETEGRQLTSFRLTRQKWITNGVGAQERIGERVERGRRSRLAVTVLEPGRSQKFRQMLLYSTDAQMDLSPSICFSVPKILNYDSFQFDNEHEAQCSHDMFCPLGKLPHRKKQR